MTRSGVVESIHAFAGGSNIGLWFQVFLFVIAGGGLFLLAFRRRELSGSHNIVSLLSREAAFYLNNLVLLMIAAIVFFFSFWPKLSHDWLAQPVKDSGWFKATLPFFALLLFLTAIGPGLGWVKTSFSSLRRNFLPSVLVTVIFTVGVYVFFGMRGMLGTWPEVFLPKYFHEEAPRAWDLLIAQHPTALYPTGLFLALSCLIFCTVFSELFRAIRGRKRVRGESTLDAFLSTVLRNNRRWGGYTVHLGIAIITVGIVGSSMFQVKKETELSVGESTRLGPYQIELTKAEFRQTAVPGEPYIKDEVVFRVHRIDDSALPLANGVAEDGDSGQTSVLVTELRPEGRFYPKQQQWIYEVSIHRRLLEDIYVYAKRVVTNTNDIQDLFTMTLYINPLMMLIYLGWFTMVAGAIYAALPMASNRVGLSE